MSRKRIFLCWNIQTAEMVRRRGIRTTKLKIVQVNWYISMLSTVKDCENPPGGFNPKTMQFSPTRPHPGTTTTVVCKPGFYPRPTEKLSKTKHLKADDRIPLAEFKCTGRRASSGAADPSQYKTSFIYDGLPLNECNGKQQFMSNHIQRTVWAWTCGTIVWQMKYQRNST